MSTTTGRVRPTRLLNTETLQTSWGLWFVPSGQKDHHGMLTVSGTKVAEFGTEQEARQEARRVNAELRKREGEA